MRSSGAQAHELPTASGPLSWHTVLLVYCVSDSPVDGERHVLSQMNDSALEGATLASRARSVARMVDVRARVIVRRVIFISGVVRRLTPKIVSTRRATTACMPAAHALASVHATSHRVLS